MTSVSKYVKDETLKQVLKNKDKEKKGENGSIGTVATRGAIIETLFNRGYITKDGKNIIATPLGKDFYMLIPNKIKTAEVTAKWWIIQEEIKTGSAGVNDLMMEKVKEFESIKEEAYKNQKLANIPTTKVIVGKCPICSHEVIEINTKKGKMWVCIDSKKGCTFKLYKNTKRFEDIIKLTTNKVKKLLSKKHIEGTLTSKTGKSYQAYIKLNINNGCRVTIDVRPLVIYKRQ